MSAKKSHNVAFAWFGIAAVVVFMISWICAMSLDSSWVFAEDYLSDFGISDTDAKLYFNYGCCMITALLLVVFGFASVAYSNNHCTAAGGILLVIACILLCFIGIVTANFGDGELHKWFAYGILIFLLLSVILYSAGFWANGHEAFVAVPTIIIFALIGVYITEGITGLESWGALCAIPVIITMVADLMLTKVKPRRE